MRYIRTLSRSDDSQVDLIEEGGKQYVLKTADVEDVVNEKRFFVLMQAAGMPTLALADFPFLQPNQLALEYVVDSPTLGLHLTPELCTTWGQRVRQLHTITAAQPARLTATGQLQTVDWKEFIQSQIERGIARKQEAIHANPSLETDNIVRALQPLLAYTPPVSTLIHGDLHPNNVLMRNRDLVLYDKNSVILYGDPLYDLAIVFLNFPNGRYIHITDPAYSKDEEFLLAFQDGYGHLTAAELTLIDRYVILRACNRHPNPYEVHNVQIMTQLTQQYGA